MPLDQKMNRLFDEHEFWMPHQVRAGAYSSPTYEKETSWLNLVLSAIETPHRFTMSYELFDFVHSRIIRKPHKLLRIARQSSLPPFYFFLGKN
ncbi:MAG: hypothetical protein IRZ29_06215 [Thermoflavifilum sp.]|nr:hypothetical protein [Thermoflavifilum sp.]